MSRPLPRPDALATELRNARRQRGLSIATLAVDASVSPRLISEFEQGKRPNVSLETALRLLTMVGVSLHLHDAAEPTDSAPARAERAAQRRNSWTGTLSALHAQAAPEAPARTARAATAVAAGFAALAAARATSEKPAPWAIARAAARFSAAPSI